MQTTFDGWIMNPMVKDNAVFTHRDMYRKLYTEKFDKVLLREAGKIDYKLYFDKKHDSYFIHIKIPSEVVEKFYYDVVVQFYTDDNAIRATNTLRDYSVRFYSNDPAFVFTYLRVFRKNDMFFEDLAPRSPKQALNKDPKQKNPYEVISYVKSLYFAFLFMKAKNLFSKSMYSVYGSAYDKKELIARVRDANIVIEERQRKGEELEKKKREDKRKLSSGNSPRTVPGSSTVSNTAQNVVKKSNVSVVSKITPRSKITNTVKKTKRH